MIPEAHRDAVTTALQAAFGVAAPDSIHPLTEGMSQSLVYRLEISGRPYALRIHLREYGPHPTRHFLYMQQAAEAGIAPRVHYANEADKIVITDFVERKPFPADMVGVLAPVLRRLHALPPFHESVDQFAVIEKFVAQFDAFSVGDLFERYAEVAAMFPRNADRVSSHHDLKPENMAFDGERLLLLDWEAAFLDDRNFDLVIPGNFFVRDDAALERYLTLYYGAPPTPGERARYELVRITEHVFYAAFLAALVKRAGLADDGSSAPEFAAFHDELLAGLIVREPAQQLRYAKAHAAEGLRRVHSARFREWLVRARD
jgi:aminoglycoside phosphotransferase (APT) family kinase protein